MRLQNLKFETKTIKFETNYTLKNICLDQRMDISTLLAQTEMSYSKPNFHKNTKHSKQNNNRELIVSVFEQNLDLISNFLYQKDIQSLRLLCRGVGYLFIVRELWTGMKTDVAYKKLQDIDDYEFIEEEPKHISKQDKKIRIHSLKKNLAVSVSKNPKRQASNIKQKKLSMSIIDNELNPFQKTEIGFKRLLKTNNPSIMVKKNSRLTNKIDVQETMSIERLPQLLQIPADYSIDDLIINPNDQWVKNMHRANNLISVVKKWNSFHQRFWNFIKKQQSQLLVLMKKVIKIDGCLLAYRTTFEEQPHSTILSIIQQSAPKNALIQEQLNKLGKQFLQNHKNMKQLILKRQTEHIITSLHECYQKISQKINKPILEAGVWAEGLGMLEQAYDNLLSKISNERLNSSLSKSITNVFKSLTEQHISKKISFNQNEEVNFRLINLRFIIYNPQFCQLAFQILYSFFGKLGDIVAGEGSANSSITGSSSSIKPNELSFNKKLKPVQKAFQSKLIKSTLQQKSKPFSSNRQQKTLYGILWNISKYFDKLQKQLASKQKKKKQQNKVSLIRKFIESEADSFAEEISLICCQQNQESYKKGLNKIEDYYKNFKGKIERLKEDMSKTEN